MSGQTFDFDAGHAVQIADVVDSDTQITVSGSERRLLLRGLQLLRRKMAKEGSPDLCRVAALSESLQED